MRKNNTHECHYYHLFYYEIIIFIAESLLRWFTQCELLS